MKFKWYYVLCIVLFIAGEYIGSRVGIASWWFFGACIGLLVLAGYFFVFRKEIKQAYQDN